MEFSNINNNKINNYMKIAHKKIYTKYSTNLKQNYNLLLINNILSNSKCHIVALFKEYLLYDEHGEFLKRYYKYYEITSRLIKTFNYYSKTYILYPNYSPLFESKYLYRNIIKKQMIINKMIREKKRNIKKEKEKEIKDENKNEDNFFSNTIYNDILNESKSFTSLLFGEEGKNKKNEQKLNDKIENEKEIEDFTKIIDMIEKTEVKKKKILDFFINSNEKRKKLNNKKSDLVDIQVNSSTKFSNQRNKILYINNMNNYSNSIFFKSTTNSTASGTNSNVNNTIQNQKYFLNKYNINKNMKNNRSSFKLENTYIKINNNNNNININTSKENINNNNEINYKNKKNDKIIYHRKVKSTLIGEYLNRLDLPSNLNVVNSLKTANEAYGDSQNKNIINLNFRKKFRNVNIKNDNSINNKSDLINSMTKIINLPNKIHSNINTERSSKISIFKTPKGKENTIIKLTKMKNSPTKIEIPFFAKKPLFNFIKKRNSPIYIRNHISPISFNNSNGEIQCNTLRNTILNSSRKPKNSYNSILNQNITSPYSKPKCIHKDKKNINISGKNLFNNSHLNLSSEIDKHI